MLHADCAATGLSSNAQNIEETVPFYETFLDVKIKRIANDAPGHKHYSLDLGGGGTLDCFGAEALIVFSERRPRGTPLTPPDLPLPSGA